MEDILGPGYTVRRLELRPDAEGEVVATLVQRGECASKRAVLYVHGFVDYFFQTQLADAWAEHGFDFYALDLRKYGRSLLPHQTPNYVDSLDEYDEELDLATRLVREDGHEVVVVMAHSTGGLVTSLWADRRPGAVDALVLNSPWFDLNASLLERTVATWAVDRLAPLQPRRRVGKLGEVYGRSLHVQHGGAWDYDLVWKPLGGFPVLLGWLRAIRRGHARLARGLQIGCPVLVCASTRSAPNDRPSELTASADAVLDVEHIAGRAHHLGPLVTIARIEGGIHDLALSAEPARQHFLDEVFRWTAAYVPETE